MLEVVRLFDLQYSDKAQGILGILVATPSLLSKVIESQGQDIEILLLGTRYNQVQVTKAGLFTRMIVFGIGEELWFPSR